ncbi:MAG: hypothetical protein ACR2QC_09975 [Gammaproteobacteria bacterium]
MFFAAVLATTAANAQEARAQVYFTSPLTWAGVGDAMDLSESLADIFTDLVGDPINQGAINAGVIARVNEGGGETSAAFTASPDGLPVFAGAAADKGDVLRFRNAFSGINVIVRVYDSGGTLAVAAGETPTVIATVDTAAGEFFLLTTGDVWTATNEAVDGTQGYTLVAAAATDPEPGNNGDSGGGNPVGDNDSNARDLAVIGLGVGVVGFMAAYLSGGDFSLFNFAPDFGYSATESGYSVNTGGRLNFRKDGWHLYAAAGQANANGEFSDFRYESGGKYAADFWTAAFSETVQGETADYNFSLSADYHGGIWRLSPTYRLHSRLEKDETETRNSLNLEGVLRYNRWTISPSAGFRWESAEEFGDNARFNLSAVRRF